MDVPDEAFNVVEGGLNVEFPTWRRIRQKLDAPRDPDVRASIAREMERVSSNIRPGMTVAVGVGSRGVARLSELVEAVLAELRQRGARPFVVPAMGSHGGGTPEGQRDLLEGYGITAEKLGISIEARMDTTVLGRTDTGFEVNFSQAALAADAVFVINRVKVHTDFHGPFESGLAKMLVIGLGKHKGAAHAHQRGSATFEKTIPEALRLILQKVNVLGGLAVIENAREEIAQVEVVPGEDIPAREPQLLDRSRQLLPRIPFEKLDVLVVDCMGKNLSGSGLDPNVTGRYFVRHIPNEEATNPYRIAILRLTELSHGNAAGLGVADVITRAVAENIDYQKFWTNTIASTELGAGRTPVWMPDDRQTIGLALATTHVPDTTKARLVRIESTLQIEEFWVSEALWQSDGKSRSNLEPLTEALPISFTAEGNLVDLPLPAFHHGRQPWTRATDGYSFISTQPSALQETLLTRRMNFNPGPATLPLPALEKARDELLDFEGSGMSIIEHSHRGAQYEAVHNEAIELLKELLNVPDGYEVLFMQGGASQQFAQIPMNFLQANGCASYVVTGSWSEKARAEAEVVAKQYGARVATVASTMTGEGKSATYSRVPNATEIRLDGDAAYLHLTSNETIHGVQFGATADRPFPQTGTVPLVADMSSDFLWRPFDVSQFAMVYAGAQKNLGPSGVTVVLARKDFIESGRRDIPSIFQYRTFADSNSMYNTPPTFAVYLVRNVLQWVKSAGGLAAIEATNRAKAGLIYSCIDSHPDFYRCPVEPASRSVMNAVFFLPNGELERKFLKTAEDGGMVGLKGHRVVGGIRVSMYNAVSLAWVQQLVSFMDGFVSQA